MTIKEIIKEQANIDISNLRIAQEQGIITEFGKGKMEALEGIADFIDNFEVKEINLEKELEREIDDCWFDYDGTIQRHGGTATMEIDDVKEIAKHFFELGTVVNNPITAADIGMAEEIIINLKRIEQDYHIDLTKEMEWLRNKVQKGE